jgi:hypothetical protein
VDDRRKMPSRASSLYSSTSGVLARVALRLICCFLLSTPVERVVVLAAERKRLKFDCV